MGNSPSAQCLLAAVGGNSSLVAFPNQTGYYPNIVEPYNLDYPVLPAAVTFPETAEQVAAIVKCAAEAGYKVQPKSGGHNYGNYGLELLLGENDFILTRFCYRILHRRGVGQSRKPSAVFHGRVNLFRHNWRRATIRQRH